MFIVELHHLDGDAYVAIAGLTVVVQAVPQGSGQDAIAAAVAAAVADEGVGLAGRRLAVR